MVVQFMRKTGFTDMDVLKVHPKVQASLAHGFCLLVQLLVDKNSNVCARAKYLIPTIKESSLEVTQSIALLKYPLPKACFLSIVITLC